ncbi:MAG: nuclear transport factor 2 family protein [Labilibaculum sp.]|nr:nuclear transport factor 2 family protein [Labilibaculum sp.]MBI9056606.1 nuclear transport factor 2 family protein [Labilibaculum sp.]
MSLPERVKKLNDMILGGFILQAFEKFYAENVMMQENATEPIIGKDAYRKKEKNFVTNIIEFRNAVVKNVLICDNTTVLEWELDYTHADWGCRNFTQIAVQPWNGD